MARGFRRGRHGVRARLDPQEQAVLAHLFVEVYDLLDDETVADPDPIAAMVGIGTAVDLPGDPALARLLPNAHRDDPEASAEFRRYTEQGLRERKRHALETARLTLGREGGLTLSEQEEQAWLTALTDVRLVLAERMGLRTEEDHERLMERLGVDLDAAPTDLDEFEDTDDLVDESGPEAEAEGQPDEREHLAMMVSLYDFLTWLQETLVQAVVDEH